MTTMSHKDQRTPREQLESLSIEQLFALVVLGPGLTDEDFRVIRAIARERLAAGEDSAEKLLLELIGRQRETLSVQEASRDFDSVLDRVATDHVHVDLERDRKIVAVLSPATRWVKVSDLNSVFASLPSLGDDAESFADDVDSIRREIPRDADPWM